MKGSYILEIELKNNKTIKIGKLGDIFFKKGTYFYVGSALNGIESRIKHHLKKDKKNHWHIDYLLRYATIKRVVYKENAIREECNIAKQLSKYLTPIHGFGCSDCKCDSHLFFVDKERVRDITDQLNMSTL